MPDLLIRIDSIDLRVGQFGENLKMLNSVLSLSGSTRRDSNFSPGLRQQFAMSGTTIHDPSDFVNSINRLNFDLSFRSNDANNTIVDVNEGLDATLDNDDPNQESPVVMTTNANSITPNDDEMLKSFYVTSFDIEQSEEDVIEYLRETINVENSTLKCVKLVPRNNNINKLSFVSFKLSVSEDLVSVINDPFYWPEGVEIREFQSKNVNPLNRVVSI